MKKTITKEITFCDECEREGAFRKCLRCHTERCNNCSGKSGKTYTYTVSFSGSGDGYYCDKCIEDLQCDGNNKLFNTYEKIAQLKIERDTFYFNFNRRAGKAEEELQKLRGASNQQQSTNQLT